MAKCECGDIPPMKLHPCREIIKAKYPTKEEILELRQGQQEAKTEFERINELLKSKAKRTII